MIPAAYVTDWRRRAPWSTDAQVEQDLVLCRAVVELFTSEELEGLLALRGGTALQKLVFNPPGRYSEDIDLVQVKSGTRGAIMDALPRVLQPWLGKSKYKQSTERLTYLFRFESEIEPIVPLRLKVEIDMIENFSVLGYEKRTFEVDSPWYSGSAELLTYTLRRSPKTSQRCSPEVGQPGIGTARLEAVAIARYATAQEHHDGEDTIGWPSLGAVCEGGPVGLGGTQVAVRGWGARIGALVSPDGAVIAKERVGRPRAPCQKGESCSSRSPRRWSRQSR